MENKKQFGRPMWGAGEQPTRKYNLPTRPEKPEVKKIDPKKESIGKSVFGSKGYLTRSELREKLKSHSLFKHGLSQEQRVKLEKEVFPQEKYGSYITKQETLQAFKDLERKQSKIPKKKFEIEKGKKTLKDILGEK